ncbi:MAG: ribosome assembly RNA-binding protein YhbY [Leptospirillia bacterium]
MPNPDLTGKQRRHLRSLANTLKATVHVGKGGVSDEVRASLEDEFSHRELVKLAINQNCELPAKKVARDLADAANAHWVQTIGHTVVLYRAAEDPEIVLPAP